MNEMDLIPQNWTDIPRTDNIFNDSCLIINQAQAAAYKVANIVRPIPTFSTHCAENLAHYFRGHITVFG